MTAPVSTVSTTSFTVPPQAVQMARAWVKECSLQATLRSPEHGRLNGNRSSGPFFSREELESGRDAALDKAREVLAAAGECAGRLPRRRRRAPFEGGPGPGPRRTSARLRCQGANERCAPNPRWER